MDSASQVPDGYRAEMPVETLNLTGIRIVPHARTPGADAAERHLRASGMANTRLPDGEDLVLGF